MSIALCMCGCGEPAPVAANTNRNKGWVKGEPLRYVWGHNGRRVSPDAPGLNPDGFCLCGCGGRTPLVRDTIVATGQVAGTPAQYIHGHPRRKGPVDYVEDENGCWIWQRKAGVYGTLNRGGRQMGAHRWYFEQANGPIPEGLQIDHLCRNTLCVNPEHLEAVTPKENMRRSMPYRLKAVAA